MDAMQPDKPRSPLKTVRRQTPADFQEEMKQAGISMTPLEVTEVKPGLHESAEGITIQPIYCISWPKQPLYLFGLLNIRHIGKRSGKFVKVSAGTVNIPPEANRQYSLAEGIVQPDESAVFLSTRLVDSHLRIILAIRLAEQWLELYRWNDSWTALGLSRLEICQF